MEKIEHNQRNIGHSVFPALVYFCCQFFNKDNQRRRKLVLTMQ